MLVAGNRVRCFLNEDRMALIRKEENSSIRVVFANGRDTTLNPFTFNDEGIPRHFLSQCRECLTLTEVRGGSEWINLSNVVGVVLDEQKSNVRVFFPNGENYEYRGEDFTEIKERIGQLTGDE